MEGVACATGLGVVGDLSSGILHSPHRRGIGAFDARYGYKKSPQALLESFFLFLR